MNIVILLVRNHDNSPGRHREILLQFQGLPCYAQALPRGPFLQVISVTWLCQVHNGKYRWQELKVRKTNAFLTHVVPPEVCAAMFEVRQKGKIDELKYKIRGETKFPFVSCGLWQLLLLPNECSHFLGRVMWHWACHQGII